jgi:glycosyltransferase involved in cell wall biosynthesis
MAKVPVSIIILTHNEEVNIRFCLESVKDFIQDIFIVDCFSIDRTLEIAREYTNKIYQNNWVSYTQQRNWAINNLPLNHDWVFFLDADERLTHELFVEIKKVLSRANQLYMGYYVKINYYFLGKWLKHGPFNNKNLVLRLFRKDKASYIDSFSFREKVVLDGEAGYLSNPIIHEDQKDLSFWISKQNLYTSIEAASMASKIISTASSNSPVHAQHLEHFSRVWFRDKVWYRLPFLIRPFSLFFYYYIFRKGFLDGKEGFAFCFLMGFWFPLIVDVKCVEITKKQMHT